MSSEEINPLEPTGSEAEQLAAEEFDVAFLHEHWQRRHDLVGSYLAREAHAYQLFERVATEVCTTNNVQPEIFPMHVNPNGGGFYHVRYRPIDYDPEPGNTDERRFIVLGGIHTLDSRGAPVGLIPRLQVYTAEQIEEGADPFVDVLRHDLMALKSGIAADGANLYQLFISGDKSLRKQRMNDQHIYISWLCAAAEVMEVPTIVRGFVPNIVTSEQSN